MIEGGFAGGTNILDTDPLFVAGAGGSYDLQQTASGQLSNSPALDAGPEPAAAIGLDSLSTRTDSAPDSGLADWGVHYRAFPSLAILRGGTPTALAPIATVSELPFTDVPGILTDPGLKVLFYRVDDPENEIRVVKDLALQTVRIEF